MDGSMVSKAGRIVFATPARPGHASACPSARQLLEVHVWHRGRGYDLHPDLP